MKEAETIDKATFEEIVQPLAFYWKKARYISIAHRIMNIDSLMTDIIIPTDDQIGMSLFEFVDIILEIRHEL